MNQLLYKTTSSKISVLGQSCLNLFEIDYLNILMCIFFVMLFYNVSYFVGTVVGVYKTVSNYFHIDVSKIYFISLLQPVA